MKHKINLNPTIRLTKIIKFKINNFKFKERFYKIKKKLKQI